MASASVYYKFKAQREPSRITFDGTGISVWELKREIIIQNKMGKGVDFDLALYNADTEEEYKDDNHIIPRSSQVVVRRLPPSKPGRGNAAQYVSDLQAGGPNSNVEERASSTSQNDHRRGPIHRGQMSMRFDGRSESNGPAASGTNGASTSISAPEIQSLSSGLEGDEASRIAAMFQATTEQWDETQERMAQATYRERPGAPRRAPRPPTSNAAGPSGAPNAAFHPSPAHDRPPPIGYICFRCGQKGHWIHDCPTNDDREFDNKPRFKRTTGIPKSMLKTVEAPTDGIHREGVMVTSDGSYVVAQVDSASWARNQAHRQKRLTRSDIYSSVPSKSELACSLCNKLARDPVKTPCCQTLFCQECITTHLLEHDFQCPECEKLVRDLGDLQRDDEIRKQVREYVDAEMDKSERKLQEAEQAEKDELDKAEKEKKDAEKRALGITDDANDNEAEEKGDANHGTDIPHGNAETDDKGNVAEGKEENEDDSQRTQQGGWNAQGVQQIMMMLCNPQLPPPMRMQLQMQLRFLHNQFIQSQMKQQNTQGSNVNQQAKQEHQHLQQAHTNDVIGAHNISNPFAGQHQMPLMAGNPFAMSSSNGIVGNPLIGMRFAGPQNMAKFHPVAPLSHQESAYMRLPVNPNKRTTTGKRERPADFLELGGASKDARLA